MFRTNYIHTNASASGVASSLLSVTWSDWLRAGRHLLVREVGRGVDILGRWHRRARSRRHLMTLDDRMLRDIGISRADAETEFRKRFWQD